MKKYILLIIVLLLITTSCSSENKYIISENKQFIANYKIISNEILTDYHTIYVEYYWIEYAHLKTNKWLQYENNILVEKQGMIVLDTYYLEEVK